MSTMSSRHRKFTAASGLAAGLVFAAVGLQPTLAQADSTHTNPTHTMTSTALLQFDDIQAAGVGVDSAQIDSRGDQLLGDAGRFDEGCLGEKTMRNITGSKAYPAPGDAEAYFDATWISSQDKDVWLSESIAQGKNATATTRYVNTLNSEIRSVRSCQEDPEQGNYYGKALTVRTGTASVTYYLDYTSDGGTDGGGVAVIRDGNRFGYVDLMSAGGKPGQTLKELAIRAARDLR